MACEKCRSAPKSTKQRESRTSTSISCWFLTFLRKKNGIPYALANHWLIPVELSIESKSPSLRTLSESCKFATGRYL